MVTGRSQANTPVNMSNFDPNAILRGAQLTLVGSYRALQNPALYKSTHYQQAVKAVAIGVVIRFIIATPIFILRNFIWILSFFSRDVAEAAWSHRVLRGLGFLENSVLQLPFFLMSLMRYLVPTLDEMFMMSLYWVDQTYLQKHSTASPSELRTLYYPSLSQYTPYHKPTPTKDEGPSNAQYKAVKAFIIRSCRKAAISLAIYLLTFLPYIGRFVLPAASFYSLNKTAGPIPAAVVFGFGFVLPKSFLVVVIQSYFASRSLVRELLEPYFSRIPFTKEQKKKWFRDREGLLFGFGVGFYLLMKAPMLGVLIYGIAEASTAYLITKITDPPRDPNSVEVKEGIWQESQIRWRNKHEFLKLPVEMLDKLNVDKISMILEGRGESFGLQTAGKSGFSSPTSYHSINGEGTLERI